MSGGDVAKGSAIRQISDPRLAVTGGESGTLGGRTYLVFGQDFQGGYTLGANPAAPPSFTQIYSDEIQRFRIVATGKTLAIKGYQALRDPTNFRRRDGNMGSRDHPLGPARLSRTTAASSHPATMPPLTRRPILIGANGKVRVDASYQQFFDQYTTANIPLYDAKSRAMIAVFMGGISIYDYDYPNGPLANLTSGGNSPGWVDDVSSLVQRKNGQDQEYIMPPHSRPGYYGAYSARFLPVHPCPFTPTASSSSTKLKRPTVLGYMYGGIYSTAAANGQHGRPRPAHRTRFSR